MDTVKSLRIFSLVGTFVPAAIVSVMPLAHAAALTHWNYDATANQLEVMIQAGATPRYFLMAQPARIVVDLPNTDVGAVKTQQAYSGVIRQIRVSQFQPGVTRMVLELSPDAVLAPGQVQLEKVGTASSGQDRWVLRPLLAQTTPAQSTSATPPFPPPIAPAVSPTPQPPLAPPISSTPQPATPEHIPPTYPDAPPITSMPTPITVPPAPTVPAIGDTTAISPTTSGMGGAQPSPPVASQPPNPMPPMPSVSDADDAAIDTTTGIEIAVPTPGTAISQSSRSSPAATPIPPTASPATSPAPIAPVVQSPSVPATTAFPPLAPPLSVTPSVPLAPPLTPSPARSLPPLAPPLPASTAAPFAAPLPATPSDLPSTLPAPTVAAPSVSVSGSSSSPSNPSSQVKVPEPAAAPPLETPKLPQAAQSVAELDLPSTLPSAKPSSNSGTTVTVPALGNSPRVPANSPSGNSSLPTLPSVNAPSVSTPSISVPPLSAPASTPLPPAAVEPPTIVNQPTSPLALPTATPSSSPTPTVSVPPLQPTTAPLPIAGSGTSAAELIPAPPQAASPSVIPFGQPLPTTTSALPPGTLNYPNGYGQAVPPAIPGVLLPAGVTLNLVYPGTVALQLQPGMPRQEVLLLQTDLRDASGQVLIPAGSTVFGRFETTSAGSQFIAQAITLQGRNVPIAAQSEAIGGSPKISESRIAINSGIGALAGGLVSQFSGWGLLGGAATGAAVTYFTSPRPAVIQPGQVVPVRVMQNLQ